MNIDQWIRDQLGGSSRPEPEPEPEQPEPEPLPATLMPPREIGTPARRIIPREDFVRRLARIGRTIR